MIKNSVRALCALSLALAPLLTASPAHAVTACTVNGVPSAGPDVTGTAGGDFIACSMLDAGHTVNALGGNDTIVLTGDISGTVGGGAGSDMVRLATTGTLNTAGVINGDVGGDAFDLRGTVLGLVQGNEADDFITVGVVGAGGTVNGGAGTDFLQVGVNGGAVDGGADFDVCQAGSGNPPVCEIVF
ncbi:hypothetical protein [Streptomyces sp. NPDC059909]|uniref:hypothetical protein n=1 Tax=Streptomyces sp. NPDC059909 TaxID=3346998 RepID=UPI00365BD248